MGDMIIYVGNFTTDIESFFEWFVSLPHRHKIVVPGEHEMTLCNEFKRNVELMNNARYKIGLERSIKNSLNKINYARSVIIKYSHQVHFLVDRSIVINGFKIYGTPGYTNRWNDIPNDIDILITLISSTGHRHLRDRMAIVKPRLHIFLDAWGGVVMHAL